MKALSINQPWAWAIIHGPKRWENRRWTTKHRGPLIVHASATTRRLADGMDFLESIGIVPPEKELIFGALVGTVELTTIVRPVQARPYDAFVQGPWCWRLENPQAFKPIPWSGRRMLFDVPAHLTPISERTKA